MTANGTAYLQARGISPETVDRYEIESSQTRSGGDWLTFPHRKDDVIVNNHYRKFSLDDPGVKTFRMDADSEMCLWNYDIMSDPVLANSDHPLIITESRIDALSFIEAGYPWVVSVPNGSQETLPFIESAKEKMKEIARFAIAVDGDAGGDKLKRALTTALPLPRCDIVTFPDDHKDANETLIGLGPKALMECFELRKHVPYVGAHYARDFIGTSFKLTRYDTHIAGLDSYFHPFLGGFMVLTGTPGSGKTLLAQNICFALANYHGIKSVIGTFENPASQVIQEMTKMYCRKTTYTEDERLEAFSFIDEHIHFVVADAPEINAFEDDPDNTDLAWFLDASATFIIREGVKVVVIDPWNELAHKRDRYEDLTDYVARMIREVKRFARRYNVFVIVVAHPTKLEFDKKTNTFRRPTLYDIAQSAAWYNKCDIGIVLSRKRGSSKLEVDIQKIRFKESGQEGQDYLCWNNTNYQYETWEEY